MNYLEYKIKVGSSTESDIVTAILGDLGFESFIDENGFLLAYIQQDISANDETFFNEVIRNLNLLEFETQASYKIIEQQNWNETWEKSFEPILLENKCLIRAPFHSENNSILNIVIEPKMSFGTGHHQTTFLMLQTLFDIDLKNKKVLDMGCGTAVLAILAEKLGASIITAIDIEEWAFENSLENIKLNNCNQIKVLLGGSEKIGDSKFDVVIANINKNVLLKDMLSFANALNINGTLLLSGFFETDASDLIKAASPLQLYHIETKTKDEWAMIMFQKN